MLTVPLRRKCQAPAPARAGYGSHTKQRRRHGASAVTARAATSPPLEREGQGGITTANEQADPLPSPPLFKGRGQTEFAARAAPTHRPPAFISSATFFASGVQRSDSALKKTVKASASSVLVSIASRAKRACKSGVCSAFTTSALTRTTMSRGNPAGAASANHAEATSPG